jgi:hypothetical protein
MTSTTDTQFSPFIETVGDTLAQLVDGAAKVGRESTKTYVAGLNAIVEQQRLAYEVSQQWVSGVVSAQSDIRQQLVESYDSAKGQLVKTAEEATKLAGEASKRAGEASGDVAESGRQAVASATRKQTRAVAKTRRRATPAKPRSASPVGAPSGPAKWTSEAYEALTAAEVVEQLPQLSQRQLAEVETYEKAHQSRQTVLQKIASLRGQEPVPGYDELNVSEINSQLGEDDVELAARVRDYERSHKNRDGVLNAAAAQLSKS